MVEKLTETNLELEERMKMMAGELADLEALRDLNEELEEERMVTERELREVKPVLSLLLVYTRSFIDFACCLSDLLMRNSSPMTFTTSFSC